MFSTTFRNAMVAVLVVSARALDEQDVNTYVPQEPGALTKQIMAADSGDTLVLKTGYAYIEEGTLLIEKDLTIMGEPTTALNSEENPGQLTITNTSSLVGFPNTFAIGSGSHKIRFRRLNIIDGSAAGTKCQIAMPHVDTPLNLTLTTLPVQGSRQGIRLNVGLGEISQGEHVTDMEVGLCSTSDKTEKLVNPGIVVPVSEGICTASVHIYVPVDSVRACGLKGISEDLMTLYKVPIKVTVEEEIWHQTDSVGLQAAVMRDTNATSTIRFTFDEPNKILAQAQEKLPAVVAVDDPDAFVDVSIVKRLNNLSDENALTEIALSVSVPNPYTLTGGSTENYTLDEDCTGPPCVQTVTYNMTGCRLSGMDNFNFPIKCQEGNAECSEDDPTSVDIKVEITMASFCRLAFDDIFNTETTVYTDETYTEDRGTEDSFEVGSQFAATIQYTPGTHPDIETAKILMLSVKTITREVDSEKNATCEDWDGTKTLGQEFLISPDTNMAEVKFNFAISNAMSCPMVGGDGKSPMNVTVSVELEYEFVKKDVGLERRRRGLITHVLSRREPIKEDIPNYIPIIVDYVPPAATGDGTDTAVGTNSTGVPYNDTLRFPLPWDEYTSTEQHVLVVSDSYIRSRYDSEEISK
eukprot:CFRG8165T1